jgi:hypothetical protein
MKNGNCPSGVSAASVSHSTCTGPAKLSRLTPGSKGEYRKAMIHAGLICLNGPVGMDLDMQIKLFETALDEIGSK